MHEYSPRKRWIFAFTASVLILVVTVGGAGGVYFYSVYRRAYPLYQYLKNGVRGWRGRVHAPDQALGFAPLPSSSGLQTFSEGPPIPTLCDENGCRIPAAASRSAAATHPLLMALGCSFTYGDAVAEEDTYIWKAGEMLGWDTVNAGVCSYGLTQMLLRARTLIPRLKPEVVIVQWSPWLVERAKRALGPIGFLGAAPIPYFYETPGGLRVHGPVFQSILFDLPFEEFRETAAGTADFISFFFRAGLPLYFHDDLNMFLFNLKKRLGLVPEPGGDDWEIERAVFGEIAELARANGGQAYILNLPWGEEPQPPPDRFAELGIPIIDAQPRLLEKIPPLPPRGRRAAFGKLYTIYRGEPPHCVDKHPNPEAHRLIAEEIVRVLRRGPGPGAVPAPPPAEATNGTVAPPVTAPPRPGASR
ncbi:MAG TPA: hypothetical protein PLI51_11965 [bacterium]|nr:hypothetical protein [bacterium]HPQ67434.1 hypothetical protein [bacterium]